MATLLLLDGTDVNSLTENGYYEIRNAINAPGDSNHIYVSVIAPGEKIRPNGVIQTVYDLTNGAAAQTRYYDSGEWGDWADVGGGGGGGVSVAMPQATIDTLDAAIQTALGAPYNYALLASATGNGADSGSVQEFSAVLSYFVGQYVLQNNALGMPLTAAVNIGHTPNADNDSADSRGDGFKFLAGSIAINASANPAEAFLCITATPTAAVWVSLTTTAV